jgi:hypothetical protein
MYHTLSHPQARGLEKLSFGAVSILPTRRYFLRVTVRQMIRGREYTCVNYVGVQGTLTMFKCDAGDFSAIDAEREMQHISQYPNRYFKDGSVTVEKVPFERSVS